MPGQDHDIDTGPAPTVALPEAFPYYPLDPVASNSTLVDLPGNRHSQTGVFARAAASKDFEARIRRNKGFIKNPLKFNWFCEFLLAGKCRPVKRHPIVFVSHRTGHPLMRFRSTRVQAERRFLPFARRALMIACPARVDIRARNPCLRARLRRLGWKVRFILLILKFVSCFGPSPSYNSLMNEP